MTPSSKSPSDEPPVQVPVQAPPSESPFSIEALKRHSTWFAAWDTRVKEIQISVGYATAGGAVLGAMMATAHYFDGDGPEKTLRGLLKRDVPKYAGRVAAVALALRVSFWGIEIVRGNHIWERDIFIAAPIAGTLYGARKGPKVAALTAMQFGAAGILVYGMDAAYSYYEKQNPPRHAQDETEYQAEEAGGAREA